jgi:TonB family protein
MGKLYVNCSILLLFFCFLFSAFAEAQPNYDSLPPAKFNGEEVAMLQLIKDRINYPERALEEGIKGKVIVRVTVSTSGSIADATVCHSENLFLDKEALRVVKTLPRFLPYFQDGKPVVSSIKIPVVFELPSSGKHINFQLAATNLDPNVPFFPGGLDSLKNFLFPRIQYPEKAFANNKEGDVLLSFNIDALGNLTHIKTISQSDNDFDKPIIDALNQMNTWEGGGGSNFGLSYSTYVMYTKFRIISSNIKHSSSIHKFYEALSDSMKKKNELFQFIPITDEYSLNGVAYFDDSSDISLYGIDRASAELNGQKTIKGKTLMGNETFYNLKPEVKGGQAAANKNKNAEVLTVEVSKVGQKGKVEIEAFPGGSLAMEKLLRQQLATFDIKYRQDDLNRVTLAVRIDNNRQILSLDAIQGKFSYLEKYLTDAVKEIPEKTKTWKKEKKCQTVYYVSAVHKPDQQPTSDVN